MIVRIYIYRSFYVFSSGNHRGSYTEEYQIELGSELHKAYLGLEDTDRDLYHSMRNSLDRNEFIELSQPWSSLPE